MCHSAIFLSALLVLSRTNAESTEEQQVFPNFYPPSTVNFHDIYSNSLALLADDPPVSTIKEEDFHISNMPSQFVEFRPSRTTTQPSTTTMDITTGAESAENMTETSTTSTSTTTEEYEESSVKVLPIKKDYQRGVLDLLFPASRVRSFKNIFDSFKRILSHTFRR